MLIYGLTGIVSTTLGGIASDALLKKMSPIKARVSVQAFVGFAVAAVTTMIYPLLAPVSFGMAIFGAILAGWGSPVTNATLGALPMDLLNDQKAANDLFALTCLVGLGAGGFVGPFIANFSMENFGGSAAMFVLGAGSLLGLIITLILPKFQLKDIGK